MSAAFCTLYAGEVRTKVTSFAVCAGRGLLLRWEKDTTHNISKGWSNNAMAWVQNFQEILRRMYPALRKCDNPGTAA